MVKRKKTFHSDIYLNQLIPHMDFNDRIDIMIPCDFKYNDQVLNQECTVFVMSF